MTQPPSGFAPSHTALEFGAQYAETLQRWSDLFAAASALVQANVRLGELATGASDEFEQWMKRSASGPFAWATPDLAQQMAQAMRQTMTPPPGP